MSTVLANTNTSSSSSSLLTHSKYPLYNYLIHSFASGVSHLMYVAILECFLKDIKDMLGYFGIGFLFGLRAMGILFGMKLLDYYHIKSRYTLLCIGCCISIYGILFRWVVISKDGVRIYAAAFVLGLLENIVDSFGLLHTYYEYQQKNLYYYFEWVSVVSFGLGAVIVTLLNYFVPVYESRVIYLANSIALLGLLLISAFFLTCPESACALCSRVCRRKYQKWLMSYKRASQGQAGAGATTESAQLRAWYLQSLQHNQQQGPATTISANQMNRGQKLIPSFVINADQTRFCSIDNFGGVPTDNFKRVDSRDISYGTAQLYDFVNSKEIGDEYDDAYDDDDDVMDEDEYFDENQEDMEFATGKLSALLSACICSTMTGATALVVLYGSLSICPRQRIVSNAGLSGFINRFMDPVGSTKDSSVFLSVFWAFVCLGRCFMVLCTPSGGVPSTRNVQVTIVQMVGMLACFFILADGASSDTVLITSIAVFGICHGLAHDYCCGVGLRHQFPAGYVRVSNLPLFERMARKEQQLMLLGSYLGSTFWPLCGILLTHNRIHTTSSQRQAIAFILAVFLFALNMITMLFIRIRSAMGIGAYGRLVLPAASYSALESSRGKELGPLTMDVRLWGDSRQDQGDESPN